MEVRPRAIWADSVRYWERGRIIYNIILAAIIVGWVVLTWPHFNVPLTFEAPVFLVFLFVMANLCYTAVYLVDLPLHESVLRTRWRWILWLAGMLFAVLVVNYWIADEIYPYVR